MIIRRIFAASLMLSLSSVALYAADDIQLAAAPADYAPSDIVDAPKIAQSLTGVERRELVKEFEGVLSMALRDYAYPTWPGRSMSDCLSSNRDAWSQQCELITPQTNSYYRFYGADESNARLKQIDVHFHVADQAAMNDLARSVSKLLGRGQRTDSGWAWNSGGSRQAKLFLDQPVTVGDPAPLHFLWAR